VPDLMLGANTNVDDWEERQSTTITAMLEFLEGNPTTAHVLGLNEGFASVLYPDDTATLLEIRTDLRLGKKKRARIDAGLVIGFTSVGGLDKWEVQRVIAVVTLPLSGKSIRSALTGKLRGEQVCVDMVATHDYVMSAALMGALSVGSKKLYGPGQIKHLTNKKRQRRRVIKRLDRAEHSGSEESEENSDDYQADGA